MAQPANTIELLAQCRFGDRRAAEVLYERHSSGLRALADRKIRRSLKARFDADDITQTVFRTFFRRLREGEFRIDRTVSLWHLLVKITLNKISKQSRRHTAQRRDIKREVAADDLAAELCAHAPTSVEAASLSEVLDGLNASLEPRELEMLRLCLRGYSTTEIARQMDGLSRWTVRRTLDWIGHQLSSRLSEDPART